MLRRTNAACGAVMSSPPDVEQLSDKRYVVLLLRMLVDRQGQIMHGEVGGVEEQDEERWIHFHGADGLLTAIQTWVASDTPTT
jgi:hypothetical protein